jgi:hypothetical protein
MEEGSDTGRVNDREDSTAMASTPEDGHAMEERGRGEARGKDRQHKRAKRAAVLKPS